MTRNFQGLSVYGFSKFFKVYYEFGCSYPKTLEKTEGGMIKLLAQGHTANKWKEVEKRFQINALNITLYPKGLHCVLGFEPTTQ